MNSNEKPDAGSAPDHGASVKVSQAITTFTDTFGLSRTATIAVILFASLVVVAGVFWFVHSAPPRTLTITSGPPGSSFQRTAERYRQILASNGVTLKILPSQGSLENLQRLADPSFHVDIGFVQAGEAGDGENRKLFSLGSIQYQPLLIFCRCPTNLTLLSDLAGKKLAVGPEGSGTRKLSLALLETNKIVPGGPTGFFDMDAEEAAKDLMEGKLDAVFLMGDSASTQIMSNLLRSPDIHILDFSQADAYTRKFSYLNKLQIPRGGIDLGKDLPPHDISLVGPTVELVARNKLHPALSDLLLEAADEVHKKPSLLQRRNEFPAALDLDLPISPDAARYYKSGKKGLYLWLPFWLASLTNRILVAFVPMLLILIPSLKFIPTAYKWRVQLRIYRRYRSLLRIERDLAGKMTDQKRGELEKRLDEVEKSVNQLKVPASFAGQFFGLRDHIGLVRERLKTVDVTGNND